MVESEIYHQESKQELKEEREKLLEEKLNNDRINEIEKEYDYSKIEN